MSSFSPYFSLASRPFLILALLLGAGACDGPQLLTPPPDPESDGGMPDLGDPDLPLPDTGVGGDELRISRVSPNHGPFVGGNSALVRGAGFTDDEVLVRVGGRLVQPADTERINRNRIAIVLPAGEPGSADVTVTQGDEEVVLRDGYHYDSFYVEPNRGATSGGTVITILGSGTTFAEGDVVRIGPTPCDDVVVVSETRIECSVPAGTPGAVDVTVESGDDELTIEEAFEYYDSADPFGGGLGGGAITNTINVTVVDAFAGLPVPDAYVMLGDDPAAPIDAGATSLLGQITFSGDHVVAPATIHVAKDCFEKTTFVSFDASDVTIFLVPWLDPACGAMGPGELPPGRGILGSFVGGELVFPGPNEFGPNPWDIVPPAREGWERVAYVATTQRCTSDACRNPSPNAGGGLRRVDERLEGERGYPFRIFTRPAAFAVYAIAGLENLSTREFRPFVMGVARDVVVGPGDEVRGLEILMDIPLDHFLDVRLEGLPEPARLGPDTFELTANVDLGGEGFIVRRDGSDQRIDILQSRLGTSAFRFFAQPALLGELGNGRLRVEASWGTGDFVSDPSTNVVLSRVRDVDSEVTARGWVGIPQASAPGFGEPIPEDRVIRWEAEGGVPADFHYITMVGEDGNPAWRMFVPGDQFEAPLPDFSSIDGLADITAGVVSWSITSIRIPGFDFNEVSYSDLNRRSWVAWSSDLFTAQRQ